MSKLTSWTNQGGAYAPASDTVNELPPGYYEPTSTPQGLFFVRGEESDRKLLRFPDSASDFVVNEIQNFWTKGALFAKYGIPHKRGILLHGPPGSGKSCTLQLICRDVIDQGGLVFTFNSAFNAAYRVLREIEPGRPLVVLMEDLDSILKPGNESTILNTLDGIGGMHGVVFVATTNYPEKLEERVANRPSRFDRKLEVPHPRPASRKMYFESILHGDEGVDLDRWVKDTEGLSLAHLTELFVSVIVLENDYDSSVKYLQDMSRKVGSYDYDKKVQRGFGSYA